MPATCCAQYKASFIHMMLKGYCDLKKNLLESNFKSTIHNEHQLVAINFKISVYLALVNSTAQTFFKFMCISSINIGLL